jgi:hypothetical protein
MKSETKSLLLGVTMGFVPFGFVIVFLYFIGKGSKKFYSSEDKSFNGFIKSVQEEASKEIKWKKS